MSQECHRELERTVGRKWDVEVMAGKANLEVRPTFINKGEIVKRLVTKYNTELVAAGADGATKLEFALCMGDDFTDEDMFRALNGVSPSDGTAEIEAENCFAVTIGPSTKPTLARWYLEEPEDVIDCVALIAGTETLDSLAAAGRTTEEKVAEAGGEPAEAESKVPETEA